MNEGDAACGFTAWTASLSLLATTMIIGTLLSGWITQRVGGVIAVHLYGETYGARFRLPGWAALLSMALALGASAALAWWILQLMRLQGCTADASWPGWVAFAAMAVIVLARVREWRATRRRMAAALTHSADPIGAVHPRAAR